MILPNEGTRSAWSTRGKRWIYHTIWATLGAILMGILPTLPFIVANLLMMNRLKTGAYVTDVLTVPPYSPICLLSAFIIASVVVRRRPDIEATLVWVIPLALLIIGVFSWNRYPGQADWWKDMWDNYFGRNCGGSECVYEFMVTEPFFTSLAYTLGACIAIARTRSGK